MAFGFDQAIDAVKSGLGELASAFGFDLGLGPKSADGEIYDYANSLGDNSLPNGQAWTFSGQDWYKVFGYQFVVTFDASKDQPNGGKSGDIKKLIYTLPIPPQSLNIRMIPASQATPTFGGVVEETNANVFWLISMSGTTGIGVSRSDTGATKRNQMAKQFRDSVSTTGLLSGSLAGINAAVSKIAGAADAFMDAGKAIASGNLAAGASGVVGAFNDTFLPPLPYSASAVKSDTNGYTESQELHRFLYTYSKLKGKKPSAFGLKFICYKTNQEWDVILQDFNIQQSASNPMLYRYSIALKAWNVKSAGTAGKNEDFDRFGAGGDLQSVNLVSPEVFNAVKDNILKKI